MYTCNGGFALPSTLTFAPISCDVIEILIKIVSIIFLMMFAFDMRAIWAHLACMQRLRAYGTVKF